MKGGARFLTVDGVLSIMLPELGAGPTLPSAAAGKGQEQLSHAGPAFAACSRWQGARGYLPTPMPPCDRPGLALTL